MIHRADQPLVSVLSQCQMLPQTDVFGALPPSGISIFAPILTAKCHCETIRLRGDVLRFIDVTPNSATEARQHFNGWLVEVLPITRQIATVVIPGIL